MTRRKAHGRDEARWADMAVGAEFFRRLWRLPIKKICIENPIMLGVAKDLIGCGQQTQIIQPHHHGHGEVKATCLWLKGLPLLKPSNPVAGREQACWKMGPSDDRQERRSATYTGIAKAFSEQWG
jgi:hypothetical protein